MSFLTRGLQATFLDNLRHGRKKQLEAIRETLCGNSGIAEEYLSLPILLHFESRHQFQAGLPGVYPQASLLKDTLLIMRWKLMCRHGVGRR